MKKAVVIIAFAVLALSLIVSWLFFFSEKANPSGIDLIDTQEKAITVGIAYMETVYPELQFSGENYEYFALYYPDDGYWAVATYDAVEKTSYNLPIVSFRKNGEIVNVGLQSD